MKKKKRKKIINMFFEAPNRRIKLKIFFFQSLINQI